jgi:hypothetical protein
MTSNSVLLWLINELMVKKQNPIGQISAQQDTPTTTGLSRQEQRKMLLDLLSIPDKERTNDQFYTIELLKVHDVTPFLKRKGKFFSVRAGKKDRRKFKLKACYRNAGTKMMREGYGYVEGLVIRKTNGFRFSHAWNVDKDDPENYDYWGIIIPFDIVFDTMRKLGNGGQWYSVLVYYKKI